MLSTPIEGAEIKMFLRLPRQLLLFCGRGPFARGRQADPRTIGAPTPVGKGAFLFCFGVHELNPA
jgi:hypothetical protein